MDGVIDWVSEWLNGAIDGMDGVEEMDGTIGQWIDGLMKWWNRVMDWIKGWRNGAIDIMERWIALNDWVYGWSNGNNVDKEAMELWKQ